MEYRKGEIKMSNQQENNEMTNYPLRMKGALDDKWADWFEGFVMTSRGDGETLLSGGVEDQAALHSVLDKVHGLGLPLLLVVQAECPCKSKNCLRYGDCQACAVYHNAKGELPFCFRERTRWNKQCTKIKS
jgi:hypothetical protein